MALESEKGVQEFGCSDSSDKRKKLDMKDANISQKDMKSLGSECEPKFDLRKSLAWDSAFFTSPGFLEPEELFHYGWDMHRLGHEQHQLMKSEMKTAATECNPRTSLAWDNAFLTSEGVLNPQELCLVNKGFKKSEMHVLSAIEELRMSSTTDSDDSSLASLELQLFEDAKASMHGLSEELGAPPKYRHMQKIPPQKKMDGPTQIKMRSLPNSRKQTGNQSQKVANQAPTPPSLKQCTAGSGEFNPSSSLKPPKSSGRVKSTQMAPTKKVSLLANEVKWENKNVHTTNGESLILSSKPSSTLKFSESKSDSYNSSSMKKKCPCCSAPSVPFHASRNLKPSGLRLPSPKIGYFDEDEEGSEEWKSGQNGIGNKSRAVKDKDILRCSKVYSQQTRQTTQDKSKDCLRNHKLVTETQAQLCFKGKRPMLQKEYKGPNTSYDSEKQNLTAFQHHPEVITTIGISGDVVIELSAKQGPQGI